MPQTQQLTIEQTPGDCILDENADSAVLVEVKLSQVAFSIPHYVWSLVVAHVQKRACVWLAAILHLVQKPQHRREADRLEAVTGRRRNEVRRQAVWRQYKRGHQRKLVTYM